VEKNPRIHRKKAHVQSSGGSEQEPVRRHGSSADVQERSETTAICLPNVLVEADVLLQRLASTSCHATGLGFLAVAFCIRQSTPSAKFVPKPAKSICRNNKTKGTQTMMRGEGAVLCIRVLFHSQICLLNRDAPQEPTPLLP